MKAMRRWLGAMALILAWLPGAPGAAEAIAPAQDLAADARSAPQAVLLILYSQADCRWCERARREVLVPLQNDPAWRGRLLIRQVDLDSDAPLVDFTGRRTTHRRFAQGEGARVTPTLCVYGSGGKRLAEPIVGFRTADFYATYVERALEEALANQGRTAK